ncbi:MAG: hypothetical protein IIB61_06105 [Planctomycetes bacterium]|nr:hypothetical protein [Planctomycetota bacterium]
MITSVNCDKLAREILDIVTSALPGVTVEIAESARWDRMCVTFRWAGFSGMLPEERFRHLVQLIPEQVRDRDLAGFVWLELEPDQTVGAYLDLPRSDDIAGREEGIYSSLKEAGFFKALGKKLGGSPQDACGGDFAASAEVLGSRRFSKTKTREAKLLFIKHGAYCDCQILLSVRPALEKDFPDAG